MPFNTVGSSFSIRRMISSTLSDPEFLRLDLSNGFQILQKITQIPEHFASWPNVLFFDQCIGEDRLQKDVPSPFRAKPVRKSDTRFASSRLSVSVPEVAHRAPPPVDQGERLSGRRRHATTASSVPHHHVLQYQFRAALRQALDRVREMLNSVARALMKPDIVPLPRTSEDVFFHALFEGRQQAERDDRDRIILYTRRITTVIAPDKRRPPRVLLRSECERMQNPIGFTDPSP